MSVCREMCVYHFKLYITIYIYIHFIYKYMYNLKWWYKPQHICAIIHSPISTRYCPAKSWPSPSNHHCPGFRTASLSSNFWLLPLSLFSPIFLPFHKDSLGSKTSYTTTSPTKLVSYRWIVHIFLSSCKEQDDFLWWEINSSYVIWIAYSLIRLNFYSLPIWYFLFFSNFLIHTMFLQ